MSFNNLDFKSRQGTPLHRFETEQAAIRGGWGKGVQKSSPRGGTNNTVVFNYRREWSEFERE